MPATVFDFPSPTESVFGGFMHRRDSRSACNSRCRGTVHLFLLFDSSAFESEEIPRDRRSLSLLVII